MLHTLKVESKDLAVGMYVSALDRPWLETPFVIQGFAVESPDEIERVQSYCDYVFVDVTKCRDPSHPLLKQVHTQNTSIPIKDIFPGRPLKAYPTTSKWTDESAQAWLVVDSLVDDVNDIFQRVSEGGTLSIIRLKRSVEPVVESMSRNPDACIWLARLKQHDKYAYQHSLSASIWAVALGRQLGLPRRDLRSLAVGCMLMDVGKLRINPDLLQAPRSLTEEEAGSMRDHVNHGVDIVKESGIMNRDVLDIVAHHHERFDGSGYPQGLTGDQIPAMARIAAIVDTYDAITSNRSHADPISPSDAIKLLYRLRNIEFQAELVEVFIQAVGIYPAGTLVELTSGEVGVVVSEYRTRRLKPKLLMLLDRRKYRLPEPTMLDLNESSNDPEAPAPAIARSLEPGAYDIDLSELEL
jgi:HD-GYP domain-containing protein (c-di-GMP phosphodiesterase class II)